MASEVFQDSIELEIDVVEAIGHPAGSQEFLRSFPFPSLQLTGLRENRRIPTVVIRNPFLQVEVAPTLGGRIMRITDRRNGDLLFGLGSEARLVPGGARGTEADFGIRWSSGAVRLNDLGPVEFQLMEPEVEGDPAGIWLSELGSGTPVSVLFGISVPADRAEIQLEMRTYNRAFHFVEATPRVLAQPPLEAELHHAKGAVGLWVRGKRTGFWIEADPVEVRHWKAKEEISVGRFHGNGGTLWPRQLDTWTATLVPFSGLPGLTHTDRGIALWVGANEIGLFSSKEFNGKLVLLTTSGNTLEAPVSLPTGRSVTIPLSEAERPEGIGLLSVDRREFFRWERSREASASAGHPLPRSRDVESRFARIAADVLDGSDRSADLAICASHLGLRSASLALSGIVELRRRHYVEAAALFQESLGFNAEDHLTWWLLAASNHLGGVASEDRGELLNAHFLAPLEPVLRAESFLGQDPDQRSASLLEPLAEDPAALVDVACILTESGMYEDLSLWIRTALSLRETPMLRYLLAASLVHGGLRAEAAMEVTLAGKGQVEPPYPWRSAEKRALKMLAQEFPKDEKVRQWLALFPEN